MAGASSASLFLCCFKYQKEKEESRGTIVGRFSLYITDARQQTRRRDFFFFFGEGKRERSKKNVKRLKGGENCLVERLRCICATSRLSDRST